MTPHAPPSSDASEPLARSGPPIAYLGSRLPSLSETFVSGELQAVRAAGRSVVPCSLYTPATNLGGSLHQLASEAVVVYSRSTLLGAAVELLTNPIRSIQTISLALTLALSPRDIAPAGARVRSVPQAFAAIGLARRLRSRRVGHVHAHMANTPTSVAMFTAHQLRVPFSFTGHANDLFVHGAFLRTKLARAAFVACISRWHRAFYQRIIPLPENQTPVIRCGVDVPHAERPLVHPLPAVHGDDARRALHNAADAPEGQGNAPAEPLRLVSVARLVPKKGIDDLLRALAIAISSAPSHSARPIRCTVIGDGPQKASLVALTHALGLNGTVDFAGAKPHEVALAAVREADLFVLPCKPDPRSGDRDGIPVSIMEAMAAGRCVITSDLEPITELVMNDATGLTIPPSDVQQLARAIALAATDSALRTRLGFAARTFVASEFGREVNAHRLLNCFDHALSAGARPHPTTHD